VYQVLWMQSQLMEHWLQSLTSGLQLMLARQY
jgi:hypothetical protein